MVKVTKNNEIEITKAKYRKLFAHFGMFIGLIMLLVFWPIGLILIGISIYTYKKVGDVLYRGDDVEKVKARYRKSLAHISMMVGLFFFVVFFPATFKYRPWSYAMQYAAFILGLVLISIAVYTYFKTRMVLSK